MASSIVLKRLVSGNIINRSLRPVGSAASSRFTATEGQILDSDRRSDAPLSSRREFHRFPDAISPFLPRSLSQIINTTHSSTASGIGCNGDAMETLNGMYFSKGMSTMVSKGGSQKSSEEDGNKRNFSTTAALPDESYKTKSLRPNKPQLSSAAPILDKISLIILPPIVLASHLFSKVGSVALTYGNFSLFKHINDGMKEILADYVHHEMTRNLILISLRLFLLIVIKDVFLSVVF